MKASQLVAELQRAIEEHGDLETIVFKNGHERAPRVELLEPMWRDDALENPTTVFTLN